MEKRPEPRVSAEIPVRVWGMDAEGKPFFQNATASNLSSEGAQLTRISHSLKMGDVIGVQYGERKARFTIKWVKSNGVPKTVEAGVQILPGQTVPWEDMTEETKAASVTARYRGDKRRFIRHRVLFPIVISFPSGARPHMQCSATDIGGCGCYVETLVPLAIGTEIVITFWIDSDKLSTKGIVRASDPGVGMGIEFTSLTSEIQHRLQAYLDKIDKGFASAAGQGS
ncbi:MAG TPA: PilZ domain-containing protein [Terriglobales bacterium]|nr:PilZ domain-containing protein [Terriglobales bacterium]